MTLPGAVRDLALRLGASPARIAGPVHLTQTGSMKLRLDTDGWLPFRASQTLEVTRCAFSWRARFWPLGYLTVLDALVDGEGRMDVTAFGVFPLVRSRSSAALTKGELQRYLAELPYAPDAILHNPALEWREIDRNRLAVATGSGAQRAEVIFTLDPDGHIGSVWAEDRPRSATSPTLPTPWEGQFSDYRLCQGRSVPYSAEVAWMIDGKRNLYWRGSLTDWMLVPPVSSVTSTRPRRPSETLRDRPPAVGTASPRITVTENHTRIG
ncbi:DUF6544 family protein [Rhodobacter sp. SY28-1]|uniref:DUF6544 family protein n=1 Tax=Rhodobacter sp. SY28-1 TaxID=2562317 RepID=UPI0010C08628|nr:DUF6544 family protein [Rhodobacter sp. SY28-1]